MNLQEEKHMEIHPLEPFLPATARMLMLGSFPPPRARWSMDFYYPNLQNDMWRIFGLVFFGNSEYFLTATTDGNRKPKMLFSKERIVEFLDSKGIALSDTAKTVIREKGNASDKFLRITETTDLAPMLSAIPLCRYIVTTGDKATSTLAGLTGAPKPSVGGYVDFTYAGRSLRHYRTPSSSRAYPSPLARKAEIYARMMRETGLL